MIRSASNNIMQLRNTPVAPYHEGSSRGGDSLITPFDSAVLHGRGGRGGARRTAIILSYEFPEWDGDQTGQPLPEPWITRTFSSRERMRLGVRGPRRSMIVRRSCDCMPRRGMQGCVRCIPICIYDGYRV